MRHYELVVVLSPMLNQEQASTAWGRIKDFITNRSAELDHEETWGTRRLAYAIKKGPYHFLEGSYHLTRFSADTPFNQELLTFLRLDEQVLRSLLTVTGPPQPIPEPAPVAQVAVAEQPADETADAALAGVAPEGCGSGSCGSGSCGSGSCGSGSCGSGSCGSGSCGYRVVRFGGGRARTRASGGSRSRSANPHGRSGGRAGRRWGRAQRRRTNSGLKGVELNKIIVIGYLGRDPEMRYLASGQSVTNFSVASSRRYTTAAGEQREETEWFNVSAFGRLAETCNQYLTKGRQVYVEGRLRSRSYQGNDGQTRFSNDINLTDVQFLGRTGEGMDAGGAYEYEGGRANDGPGVDDVDDLPF